jgi:CSLREA domain-containing protein
MLARSGSLSANKSRVCQLFLSFCLLAGLALTAQAATYTVTKTADTNDGVCDADCSLREAITAANANPGVDVIRFAIGSGLKTIMPLSALPVISDPVVIDGTTQPGFSGAPLIEIDGENAGDVGCLDIQAGNTTIRGLIINRFRSTAISLSIVGNNLVAGNYIGTNSAGSAGFGALNNNGIGVLISSANNTVGGIGVSDRNIISGNTNANGSQGVWIFGAQATGNSVIGNYIGPDVTGTLAIGQGNNAVWLTNGCSANTIGGAAVAERNVISGNPGAAGVTINGANNNQVLGNYIGTKIDGTSALANSYGVQIVGGSLGNQVGGTNPGEGNTIAFGFGPGVVVTDAGTLHNSILGNSIFSNSLGIDLGFDGVTPNDLNDTDGGPNFLQNFPIITSASSNGGVTAIAGTLNSLANAQFRIELFATGSCNASGNGEGKTFLGATNVMTIGNDASFNVSLPVTVQVGAVITATATSINGDTSEFSPCKSVTNGKTDQTINFGALGNKTFGDPDFTVSATASSGLPVSFSASGACTVNVNAVHPTGAGSCTITAKQAGDANFNPAPDVPRGFSIAKAATSTTVLSSVNPSASGQSVIFTTTVTPPAGTGTPTGTVQFKDNGANLGAAQTLNASGKGSISTLSLSLGTHAIIAAYSGDANFAASSGGLSGGQVVGSIIQFSSSAYTVGEGDGHVNITITRTGDTTSSASVGFATVDGAGLTNCNVFNGIASPRCDYENTIGTATWAAGDAAAKTFSVAIVDDSYAEGNETFTVSLNSPAGASLGTQSTAAVLIIDNDPVTGPNPIDNTNLFVRQQYLDFLGREPDPPGFAGWTSTINNCAPGDTNCDRIHVSQLFFQSQEFQERGYFVYRFYPVAFGRKPDYGEFVPDLAGVSGFLDANQLEAAKVAFIAGFMARPAFVSAYNSLNNSQYVDALLSTAGVTLLPSPATRQALIDGLNNSSLTRAKVLRQIVESPEVSTKYNHQAYAVMEYFGYLRRQPDAFYLQWIQVLDQSNDPRGMVTGFVNSAEYRQRFGPN